MLTFLPSALDAAVSALARIPSILTEIPIAKTNTNTIKMRATSDPNMRVVRFKYFDKPMAGSFFRGLFFV
jgi:hypothetical protein